MSKKLLICDSFLRSVDSPGPFFSRALCASVEFGKRPRASHLPEISPGNTVPGQEPQVVHSREGDIWH